MDRTERKFTRKPRLSEILEAFPSECVEQVPLHIQLLEKELNPYRLFIQKLMKSDYPQEWKDFFYKAVKEVAMPRDKVSQLNKLRALEQLMRNDKGKINQDDIDRAREVPIESLYDEWKGLHKTARGFTACCPFHQDNKPSFSVRDNKFICFGCLVRGDAIEFVRMLNHLNFTDAILSLNGQSVGNIH